MMQGNNGQREDAERYALPEDLRRRLIEVSGCHYLPLPDLECERFESTNVIDFERWRQRRLPCKR
jgi:hypothetical protein